MYFQIKKSDRNRDNRGRQCRRVCTTLENNPMGQDTACQQNAWDLESTTHAIHTAKCKWVKCYFSCLIESFPIGLNWGMHANCFLMLLSLVMSGCTCWECLDSTSNSGPGIRARFLGKSSPLFSRSCPEYNCPTPQLPASTVCKIHTLVYLMSKKKHLISYMQEVDRKCFLKMSTKKRHEAERPELEP